MKKIVFAIICMILLSGCGSKLTCTYKETYEDVKIKNKITFYFKDKKYKQRDTMTFKTSSDAEKYFSDIDEYREEYNLLLEKNKIVSEIEDKMTLSGNKSEIKKQYESYGYKCK